MVTMPNRSSSELQIPRLEPHIYSEDEYEQVRLTVERLIKDLLLLRLKLFASGTPS
jgi:hypothetical protein